MVTDFAITSPKCLNGAISILIKENLFVLITLFSSSRTAYDQGLVDTQRALQEAIRFLPWDSKSLWKAKFDELFDHRVP